MLVRTPIRFALLAALLTVLLAPALPLAAQAKDILDISALASTPDSVPPLSVGGAKNKSWVYPSFCDASGTFTESFPFNVSITDNNGHPGDTYKVNFTKGGTLAPYATLPANLTGVPDDGTVTGPLSIDIATSGLAPGTYTLTVTVSGTPPGKLRYNHKTMSMTLVVGATCVGSFVAFYSDPQLNDLVDCALNPVGTATGGTFGIGPPAGPTATFTNPSHFYYSFIWINTSAGGITAEVDLASLSGISPNGGTDSVHGMAFDSGTFTPDLTTFNTVNTTGTSCGAAGPCTIPVATAQTLWVTWSFDWSGIGTDVSGYSASCPNDLAKIDESTLLKNAGTTYISTEATANGYLGNCATGDVNSDGSVNTSDVLYLINFLFAGGPDPVCGSADVTGDLSVGTPDVLYLINFLFAGGPPPV